ATFNDAPTLTDKTINQFLDVAESIDKTKDPLMKADTAGTLQSLVGLWQIFCRQGALPAAKADETMSGILTSFAQVRGDRELFDAGRAGVKLLLTATGSKPDADAQAQMVELL